jgi:hypothetical protein
MEIDRKLIMCLIWRVIDYGNRLISRLVFDMVSYRLRRLANQNLVM